MWQGRLLAQPMCDGTMVVETGQLEEYTNMDLLWEVDDASQGRSNQACIDGRQDL